MKDTTPQAAQTTTPGAQPEAAKPEMEPKKIVAALLTSLEHKLGRPPTTQELVEALQTKEDPQADQEQEDNEGLPKVLKYRIYYGLKDDPTSGQKVSDPETPLYYENHEGNSWFDPDSGMWNDVRPQMLDHLQHRVLGDSDSQKDLFDAIVFGVLDDEDVAQMSAKQGMLDPRCERAYELHKKAREQFGRLQELEKSLVPKELDDNLQQHYMDEPRQQENNISTMMTSAGLPSYDPSAPVAEDEIGEVAGGGAKHVEFAQGPGMEPRLRRWIREEIQNMMDAILDKVLGELEGMSPVSPGGENDLHGESDPENIEERQPS